MQRTHLLAVLWTLCILAACSLPGDEIPDIHFDLLEPDKIAHFTLFFVLGWLWLKALPTARKTNILLGALGTLYAILTEVYQGVIPLGRTPDPMDSVANLIGLFAAMGIYHLVQSRGRFLSSRNS